VGGTVRNRATTVGGPMDQLVHLQVAVEIYTRVISGARIRTVAASGASHVDVAPVAGSLGQVAPTGVPALGPSAILERVVPRSVVWGQRWWLVRVDPLTCLRPGGSVVIRAVTEPSGDGRRRVGHRILLNASLESELRGAQGLHDPSASGATSTTAGVAQGRARRQVKVINIKGKLMPYRTVPSTASVVHVAPGPLGGVTTATRARRGIASSRRRPSWYGWRSRVLVFHSGAHVQAVRLTRGI
jgi:hypothetical protein